MCVYTHTPQTYTQSYMERYLLLLQLAFIHSTNKYLLNTYNVPGSVAGSGDRATNNTGKTPALVSGEERQTITKCTAFQAIRVMVKNKAE